MLTIFLLGLIDRGFSAVEFLPIRLFLNWPSLIFDIDFFYPTYYIHTI